MEPIETVHKRAVGKYSQSEIKDFINIGRRFAQKSLFYILIETVKAAMNDDMIRDIEDLPKAIDDIVAKIVSLQTEKESATTRIKVHKHQMTLNICLTICEKGYVPEVLVPDDATGKELFEKYNFIKNIAIAYWRQFCEDYPELLAQIRKVRPDVFVEGVELTIDEKTPTSLYLDPKLPQRMSVFAFWTDKNGQAYKKRGKK